MSRFLSRAGEQVAELAEQSADEGRLSRGRALFRKGSVSDLSIVEGSVMATVRGSQGDDYETTVSTTPAPPGVRREVADGSQDGWSVDDLIDDGVDICPRVIDLAFICDCADWDEPCKHVVAVLLAFADRVDLDEAELLHWRSIDSTGASAAGSTKSGPAKSEPAKVEPDLPERPTTRPRFSPQPEATDPGEPAGGEVDRATKLSELESLLGNTVMRVPTTDDPGGDPTPSSADLEPALADFLGVDTDVDPIDVSTIAPLAPLFTSVELGPLADLGPVLAEALAIIAARLEDTSA